MLNLNRRHLKGSSLGAGNCFRPMISGGRHLILLIPPPPLHTLLFDLFVSVSRLESLSEDVRMWRHLIKKENEISVVLDHSIQASDFLALTMVLDSVAVG